MKRLMILTALLTAVLSLTAFGAENAGAVPSVNGALHVEGTGLFDSAGQRVQLRGVSTHGVQWYPQYVNEGTFRELRDKWNMNAVRLAMYTAEGGWCEADSVKRSGFRELLAQGIEAARAADVYAILDWHILSDGDPNTHLEEAKAFFAYYSERYRDADHILYEICNEPNGATTWADIKRYAEQVIPVIRANDPDAVILVGTPFWSQRVDEAAADPIRGYDNLMYTLHFYAATHKDELRGRLVSALNSGLPVFVSECGLCEASGNGNIDEESAGAWLSLLDENGVSYLFWNLSNKAESSALLSSSSIRTSGFLSDDLSRSGKWINERMTGEVLPSRGDYGRIYRNDVNYVFSGPGSYGAASQTAAAWGSKELTVLTLPGSVKGRAVLREEWEENGRKVRLYDITLTSEKYFAANWSLRIPFPSEFTLRDSWGGEFTKEGLSLIVKNLPYNGEVREGTTIGNIGFIAEEQ